MSIQTSKCIFCHEAVYRMRNDDIWFHHYGVDSCYDGKGYHLTIVVNGLVYTTKACPEFSLIENRHTKKVAEDFIKQEVLKRLDG